MVLYFHDLRDCIQIEMYKWKNEFDGGIYEFDPSEILRYDLNIANNRRYVYPHGFYDLRLGTI